VILGGVGSPVLGGERFVVRRTKLTFLATDPRSAEGDLRRSPDSDVAVWKWPLIDHAPEHGAGADPRVLIDMKAMLVSPQSEENPAPDYKHAQGPPGLTAHRRRGQTV